MYGTPENYKDLAYCCIDQLISGNWKKCFEYIKELNMWKYLSDAQETQTLLL